MRRLVLGVVLGLTLLASNVFVFGSPPDVQAARPTYTCYQYDSFSTIPHGGFTRKEARDFERITEEPGYWTVDCYRDPR